MLIARRFHMIDSCASCNWYHKDNLCTEYQNKVDGPLFNFGTSHFSKLSPFRLRAHDSLFQNDSLNWHCINLDSPGSLQHPPSPNENRSIIANSLHMRCLLSYLARNALRIKAWIMNDYPLRASQKVGFFEVVCGAFLLLCNNISE